MGPGSDGSTHSEGWEIKCENDRKVRPSIKVGCRVKSGSRGRMECGRDGGERE